MCKQYISAEEVSRLLSWAEKQRTAAAEALDGSRHLVSARCMISPILLQGRQRLPLALIRRARRQGPRVMDRVTGADAHADAAGGAAWDENIVYDEM